ncbi:MAG: glycosyltransferase family 4 protein [Syntrophobacteraceae bacterium]|nr:glycosyltransferase family 4 protein [Syntrophobacteraceae bacterium]
MKIAFYCPNKPLDHPHPSGDLVIAKGLRQTLAALGHECEEIVRFRTRWFWKSPQGWTALVGACAEACRRTWMFRPDLWLTYHSYYKSPDTVGPWISGLFGIPYVLFQPMYATSRRKKPGTRLGFYMNRLALKACRHVFLNNMDDLEAMKRAVPRVRIDYIPPGILPDDFQRNEAHGRSVRRKYGLSDDAPLLMTAARFRPGVKVQSLEYLFGSLSLLLVPPEMPFRLLVAGDGPMEQEVKSLARRLLPGRVVFTGRVPREEMARYYSAADLFVFPGIGESLGMVFLEAQACGLPVVALDTAGVPQVVQHGKTGLLVPEDGGRAMAEAVRELVGNPGLHATLAHNAMDFVQKERNLLKNYQALSKSLEELVKARH